MAMAPPETNDVAPVANTTAGEWTFTTPVNFVSLDNDTVGGNVYIKLLISDTELTASGAASTTEYDVRLKDGTSFVGSVQELGFEGRVKKVSAWIDAGTVGNFKLHGSNV